MERILQISAIVYAVTEGTFVNNGASQKAEELTLSMGRYMERDDRQVPNSDVLCPIYT